MYEYRCKVIRVIDGDTVDIDIDLGFDVVLSGQRVRLHGIDTPESRTSDKIEKQYGILAKDYLKSFLHPGESAILRTIREKDGDDARGKFGRILGDFIVYDSKKDAHRSVNEMMIEYGYAAAYHGQSKDDVQQQHMENRKLLKETIGFVAEGLDAAIWPAGVRIP